MEHQNVRDLRYAKISSNHFRDVIGCFATGVTVITSLNKGAPYGATASAVSSLSLDPPMVLICLNTQSSTAIAVADSQRFVINILTENQPDIALRFASRGIDKFEGLELESTTWGAPILKGALAHIDCSVVEEVAGGTHRVFLAEVVGAARNVGAPLAYFRGRLGRLEIERDD